MEEDRRKNSRLTIGITVFYDGGFGRTKDISIDGTFIEKSSQSHLPPIGSEISLSFDFPSRIRYVRANGVVIHRGGNDDDGIGIWFKGIKERHKEFIRQFIQEYL